MAKRRSTHLDQNLLLEDDVKIRLGSAGDKTIYFNGTDLILGTVVGSGTTTIESGGLGITAGGLTVTAGGLTVTAGGLTVTAGGLTVTAGDTTSVDTKGLKLGADQDISLIHNGTNMVVTCGTGDVTVATGANIDVADDVRCRTAFVDGDEGTGVASTVALTNVTNTSLSSGVLSIKGTTANTGDNAGFIKVYVGTTVAYLPYFTDISPA